MERIQKRITENEHPSTINAVRKTVFSTWAAVITLATVFLQSGCVKDTLYNTPHPDKGAVVVSTDWSGRSSDAVTPTEHILRIGSEEQTVNSETNAFKSLFLPGTQQLLVYHQADGITVNGATATVNTLDDGTLNPMPGFLFSAAQELDVPKDDTLRVVVPMKQRIRSLTLTLKLNPGDEQRIAGTTATLTGIVPAVDLATGKVAAAEGKAIVPVFTLGTASATLRATGYPVLAASLRLLGVMTGEKQELSIAVALTNGTVQTIKTDLTDYLKNFGSGEMEPLVLDATLSLPPEVGVTATITDWDIVNNGNINVN